MPFTKEDYLPSEEELNFPDLPLTSAPLRAGAHHFGKYCDEQSKEFMLCRAEENDPRKCFKEGIQVSKCAFEFFQKVKGSCYEEFTSYWKCLDHSGTDMNYKHCKKPQKVFDTCILDKLGQERPEPGFFSKVRVHHTKRERTHHEVPLPDPTPDYPDANSVPPPESVKQGSRFFFFQ